MKYFFVFLLFALDLFETSKTLAACSSCLLSLRPGRDQFFRPSTFDKVEVNYHHNHQHDKGNIIHMKKKMNSMQMLLLLTPSFQNTQRRLQSLSRRDPKFTASIIMGIVSRGITFRLLDQFVIPNIRKVANMSANEHTNNARSVNRLLQKFDKTRSDIDQDENLTDSNEKSNEESDSDFVKSSMVMTIGFYKNFISPLLPPACRFVPTCSQYGVQAIEQFGPQKGVILTAWRILRCSPFGGKGYDPPRWPPVKYTYGSY